MTRTFILPINDDELRPRLGARETLFFVGQPEALEEEIRKQIERLGFSALYAVSATRWQHSQAATIRVEPIGGAH